VPEERSAAPTPHLAGIALQGALDALREALPGRKLQAVVLVEVDFEGMLIAAEVDDRTSLSRVLAEATHKARSDEFGGEVARLMADPAFVARLKDELRDSESDD
jgi:hypothetical protein